MKTCNICAEGKALDEFYANKKAKDGRQSCCKGCRREYLVANRDRINERQREYARRTRIPSGRGRTLPAGDAPRRSILAKYGLSLSEYEALWVAQGGRCAICFKGLRLVIDHCHVSGMVRGLLCPWCNVALGFLEDDATRALTAADYLAGAA